MGLISACDSSQQLAEDLETYQKRLSNVLSSPTPKFIPALLPAYPTLTSLGDDAPDILIKLHEFTDLQYCQLDTLIAQRNTTLGKLQLPSTRFTYEKKLLNALQTCIALSDETALREKLQSWYAHKHENLPFAWAAMLQKSPEIKQALSRNANFISGTEQDGLQTSLAALNYLFKAQTSDDMDSKVLENHWKTLAQDAFLAKLWRTQILLTQNLTRTTKWLEALNVTAYCQSKNSQKKVDYLSNVFRLYFIEKIQPVATQINYYHYQVSPILDRLLTHSALSNAFKHYISEQHQVGFHAYQTAMQEHIQFWQTLFKACDISPSQLIAISA
jgi:hypothetical protein